MVQSKVAPKMKDPGIFTILCVIDNTSFKKELCDLGVSVSLISRSIFDRLNCGELSPTKIQLQLANRSIRHLDGALLDVSVKVGDFVAVAMKEDL
jgi:hypothetical protein